MQKQGRRKLFRMIVPKYPTFNIYSNAARKITALGPLCVATAVSKLAGWEAEVIDENNYRYPGPVDETGCPDHALLHALRPADAVGFYGGLSSTIPRLYALARFYHQKGVLTVAGGQHPDFLPAEALQNEVDIVVHGEGELTIGEVLQTWQEEGDLGKVAGISLRDANGDVKKTANRPPITDFETLPIPHFGLLRFAKVKIYPVSRVRGCGNNCEFCSVKGAARCGSAERLVEQFAYLAETYRARKFFIVDDHFAQDRDESIRFCRLLADYQKKMGLRFFIFIQIRLEMAQDEALIEAMKACGIRVLAIGFESVIDEELKSMKKGMRARDMLDWTRRFRNAGFILHGMFIFGYPHRRGHQCDLSLKERIRRYKRFLRKARLDTVQVLHPVPLPGTALRARMERAGRLLSGDEISWEYYDGNFPLIQPDPPFQPEEIQNATLRIMRGFYRFNAMFWVALRVLLFPLAMLPLINVQARFRAWYRPWRRNILGFAGWSLIQKWKKRFRADPFRQKLKRVVSRRRSPSAET
jgi:radical SAM superfamily enzyme YgiQ (UPF0313 family)